jgi:hypothetical protein
MSDGCGAFVAMSELIGRAARKHFEPETGELLAEVLDAAWASLAATADCRNPALAGDTRTLLAKYIIEIAKRGERDPTRLQDQALEFLKRSNEARVRARRVDAPAIYAMQPVQARPR